MLQSMDSFLFHEDKTAWHICETSMCTVLNLSVVSQGHQFPIMKIPSANSSLCLRANSLRAILLLPSGDPYSLPSGLFALGPCLRAYLLPSGLAFGPSSPPSFSCLRALPSGRNKCLAFGPCLWAAFAFGPVLPSGLAFGPLAFGPCLRANLAFGPCLRAAISLRKAIAKPLSRGT